MQVGSRAPRSDAAAPSPFSQSVDFILDDIFRDNSRMPMPATHLAVAVSGGIDSMALSLLLQQWCSARQLRLTAFTVDHGLRTTSAAEAEQVGAWLGARGITHHVLKPPPLSSIRNPQAQARARRYGALVAACHTHAVSHLLLAHHGDDQAETVALQQHRGETPSSRAGMALVSWRAGVPLIRPLLGTRKTTLRHYLQEHRQPWLEDPTNATDRFARNRLRRHLTEDEIVSLWHEAQQQGARRQQLEQQRNRWLHGHARLCDATVVLDYPAWSTLEARLRTDLLSHVIRQVGGKAFRARQHETLRLDHQMMTETTGRATLGRCQVDWNSTALDIRPEHKHSQGLDAAWNAPHMTATDRWKTLVSEPFWWFNYPLET